MQRVGTVLLTGLAGVLVAGAQTADPPVAYRRTAPLAGLASAAEAALGETGVEEVVRELVKVARTMPEVPMELRSRAVALALTFRPDDREALVADGQLARGVKAGEAGGGVAGAERLGLAAERILLSEGAGALPAGAALADVARRLGFEGKGVSGVAYGVVPKWEWLAERIPVEDDEAGTLPAVTEAQVRLLVWAGSGDMEVMTATVTAKKLGAERVESPVSFRLPPEWTKPAEAAADWASVLEMRAAAIRELLGPRHEPWPRGWVAELGLSKSQPGFESAVFAGAAVAADCVMAGELPDPVCVLALGLGRGGQLEAIGTPVQVLAACVRQKVRHVVVPAAMVTGFTDWLLLNPGEWPRLMDVALHTARTPGDMLALSREDRATLLAKADRLFEVTVGPLRGRPDALAALRTPGVVANLEQVAAWHGQHLSARLLLGVAANRVGGSISVEASLAEVDRRSVALKVQPKGALKKGQRGLKKTPFGQAWDGLNAVRPLVHAEARTYCDEMLELARLLDRYAGKWPPDSVHPFPDEPPEVTKQRARTRVVRDGLMARGKGK